MSINRGKKRVVFGTLGSEYEKLELHLSTQINKKC